MKKRLRPKPSFANIVSMLALFVALGGSAYAVTAAKNTVTSKSIKKGAVKSVDVKNNGLTGTDVKESTLNLAGVGADACPAGAPSRVADVCYGGIITPGVDWDIAERACQAVNLRLPSIAEALLVTQAAVSGYIWTDEIADTGPPSTRAVIQTAEQKIAAAPKTGPFPYRCVSAATG